MAVTKPYFRKKDHRSKTVNVASWVGLLASGIQRCHKLDLINKNEKSKLERMLKSSNVSMEKLLALADEIEEKLRGKKSFYSDEFSIWLQETVGSLKLQRDELLHVIQLMNVPLYSTNYDSLFQLATNLKSIPWNDRKEIEEVLLGGRKGIVHLHGCWAAPESIVLSSNGYKHILKDQHIQSSLRAEVLNKSLMFVGFGAGLRDPNFGLLLEWIRTSGANPNKYHYAMVLQDQVGKFQADHPGSERIEVVPYGNRYEDLLGYLFLLLSADAQRAIIMRLTAKVERLCSEAKESSLKEALGILVYELFTVFKYANNVMDIKNTLEFVNATLQGLDKHEVSLQVRSLYSQIERTSIENIHEKLIDIYEKIV